MGKQQASLIALESIFQGEKLVSACSPLLRVETASIKNRSRSWWLWSEKQTVGLCCPFEVLEAVDVSKQSSFLLQVQRETVKNLREYHISLSSALIAKRKTNTFAYASNLWSLWNTHICCRAYFFSGAFPPLIQLYAATVTFLLLAGDEHIHSYSNICCIPTLQLQHLHTHTHTHT